MTLPIELVAESFNERTISGVARLLVTNRSDGRSEELGVKKIQISGALITTGIFPEIDDTWAMIECEVIIIPTKIHKGAQGTISEGMRSDQLLTCGYEKEENWKKHLNF